MGWGGPPSRGDSQEAGVGVCAPPAVSTWGFSAAHAASPTGKLSAAPQQEGQALATPHSPSELSQPRGRGRGGRVPGLPAPSPT